MVIKPKEVKPLTPEATGMTVIEMGYIPMEKILSSKLGTNKNRPEGPDAMKVALHELSIKNGQYRPEHFVPPVLVWNEENQLFELVTGGHRHLAHENTDAKVFYGAIVKFSDCNGKSANYWRETYQSNENKKGFDGFVEKSYRTDAGVRSTVHSLIQSGDITPDIKGIQTSLEDQGFGKNTEKGKNLLNQIRAELGQIDGVTRLYSKADVAKIVTEETTPMNSVIVRTMKDSTGYDKDYDSRLIDAIMASYSTTKKYINVFLHWTGLNPNEIIKAREVKDNVLETQYEKAKAFVEAYESGELQKRTVIRYLPQINGEYEVEETQLAA